MLSETEVLGLKNILDDINDEDIFSLLETVTKRMFTTRSRLEAIDRILSCVGNPSDLLRRQKVTKKIIFNYLLKNGVRVSSELDKLALVKKCLEFWNSSDFYRANDIEEVAVVQQPSQEIVAMGVAFCKWFFPILNTLNEFGPQHFWPKCSLQAQLCTPCGVKEVSISGANDVANFLCNLIVTDKFYFHANDSDDSIMLEEDPHGLVKIVVKGVLHQHSNCIGLFDSAFGLVKDPLQQYTYKIQLVKLILQANNPVPGIQQGYNYLQLCTSAT